jgi:8-oxo-dGTP pyrophosphatase MutT (NUDIX family)
MKRTSCATVVTDGRLVLLGHPTNHDFWEPPKGLAKLDEPLVDAALRELREETRIRLLPRDLKFQGVYPYNREKDLAVFLHTTLDLPPIEDVVCDSTFLLDGVPTPELDSWMYATWEEAERLVLPHMWRAMGQVILHGPWADRRMMSWLR